jgi:hypothetical protein
VGREAENCLIIGRTGAGKTRFATTLSRNFYNRGVGVLVCDPKSNAGWRADRLYVDAAAFLPVARRQTGCRFFVDECGQTIGRHNPDFHPLATDVRESVNATHFLMQDVTQVDPIIRDNCVELVLFRAAQRNGEHLQSQFPYDQLLDCNALAVDKTGSEFLYAYKCEPLRLCRLDFRTGRTQTLKIFPPPPRKFI